MILKIGFGVIAILAIVSGIVTLTGDPIVGASFGFGAATVAGVSLAYLIGRDGKKAL